MAVPPTKAVARNVERNDPLGAERARDADGTGLNDAPSNQPAPSTLTAQIRRAALKARIAQPAGRAAARSRVSPPISVATAANLDRQILDAQPPSRLEARAQTLAADQAVPVKEKSSRPSTRRGNERRRFEACQAAGRVQPRPVCRSMSRRRHRDARPACRVLAPPICAQPPRLPLQHKGPTFGRRGLLPTQAQCPILR